MNQIYPDEGLPFLARRAAGLDADGLKWQLYSNDVAVSLDTVLADLTLIDWDDPIELDSTSFDTVTVIGHVCSIVAPNILFENASGFDKDVYGYVIMSPGEDILVAIARFPAAPVTIPNGESQALIPIIGDWSEFNSSP